MNRIMKLAGILLMGFILAYMGGCASAGGEEKAASKKAGAEQAASPKGRPDVLVAYFSQTGNTRTVAQKIAALTGGTLYEITPEIPYSKDDLDYNVKDSRANREQNDASARPKLRGTPEHFQDVKVIFLGYPIWWGIEPRSIDTFSESLDFTGKTIIPFCTSGSSGIEKSEENLASMIPGAKWKKGRRFEKTVSEEDLKKWIKELDLSLH